MKRTHLFEFEDFKELPTFIRDGGTDFLGFVLKLFKFYKPVVRLLEDALQRTHHREILDVCSGNGGPIGCIYQGLAPGLDLKFTLSDKFPNYPAFEALKTRSNLKIDYRHAPLDVMEIDDSASGFVTMFSAIHHFDPKEIDKILKQVMERKLPIGIFDSGDKHLGTILGILLFHPILFFFCTPFFRPFRISRIIFTYLIPLIPLYTMWDGVVSIMRLYNIEELAYIAKTSDAKFTYDWRHGKVKSRTGLSVAYLIGMPKRSNSVSK